MTIAAPTRALMHFETPASRSRAVTLRRSASRTRTAAHLKELPRFAIAQRCHRLWQMTDDDRLFRRRLTRRATAQGARATARTGTTAHDDHRRHNGVGGQRRVGQNLAAVFENAAVALRVRLRRATRS